MNSEFSSRRDGLGQNKVELCKENWQEEEESVVPGGHVRDRALVNPGGGAGETSPWALTGSPPTGPRTALGSPSPLDHKTVSRQCAQVTLTLQGCRLCVLRWL